MTPTATDAAATPPTGLRRSVDLLRLYRREPVEPTPFYEFLARDTVAQLERHGGLSRDRRHLVVDVGGGPGYVADAFRQRGDVCVVVEYELDELELHGREARTAVIGDGQQIPLASGVADVVHTSNVLEHVRHPELLLEELVRVLKPGGLGYMSFTPWLSPWGGHETSPWHYLGGERAAQRFAHKTGEEAKNRYGRNLFRLDLPRVRGWFTHEPTIEVLWDGPRYWPPSWWPIARVPVVGEIATWNYLAVFRRVR